MDNKPWSNWVPGVLSDSQIIEIGTYGLIENLLKYKEDISYSSFDLHLSGDVYRMKNGAIKPNGGRYCQKYLLNSKFAEKLSPTNENVFTLDIKTTYVIEVEEKFNLLDEICNANIFGQATAKSSIGRVDVLARLIVDGMQEYESFTPENIKLGTGQMFVEVTPITFKINIKPGISLSQLRLFIGNPEESEINSKILFKNVLHNEKSDNTLSVNLVPVDQEGTVAFRAKQSIEEPISLWLDKINIGYSRDDYWELIPCADFESERRIRIEKDRFYILKSDERISIPESIAVYCRAMDESLGEMRIHYAGFVHPFFGLDRKDKKKGTPLIFEVRGHDVIVNLVHKEILAKLIFYRMSRNPKDSRVEGYNDQELTLSKFFRKPN
ncbi:MAG: 2'-deoxycytidine 5'-triphosphate deaminase [Melioribacteraceae bacterium]|nr:2'-deoxycytidine 5'-triphosphate deaminase [Melioribacteraceae bacterium]